MEQNAESRINKVVETALKNINEMVDVNTVMGKPIKTEDGNIVLPFSKITLGILSGGGEYGKSGLFGGNKKLPFSAGNGAIISIKPCGFLINDCKNEYKLLSVSESPYEKLLQTAEEMISKFKDEINNE